MRRTKSRPGDEELIRNGNEDWVERISALSRLAADGRLDLEPLARQWLDGDDPLLASEALGLLLTYWRKSSRSHDYVARAIEWLKTSHLPEVRASTAIFLSGFLELQQQYDDEILAALLAGLEHDEDSTVQDACYRALLTHVAPDEAAKFPRVGVYHFDRDGDVRWDLLAPLRERHGTPRS